MRGASSWIAGSSPAKTNERLPNGDAAMGSALKVKKSKQWPGRQATAGALAGPVPGVEVRPACVGILGADAVFHLPVAGRRAIAPAGVRRPDRGGALALRIGRLVDDATLENDLGPVFQLVVARRRLRGQTQDKAQDK